MFETVRKLQKEYLVISFHKYMETITCFRTLFKITYKGYSQCIFRGDGVRSVQIRTFFEHLSNGFSNTCIQLFEMTRMSFRTIRTVLLLILVEINTIQIKNIILFEKLLVLSSKTATQYAKILLYNCLKALISREEGTTCSISVCFGSRL